jgi:N-acetylmuramoyl-L-alanine amidase
VLAVPAVPAEPPPALICIDPGHERTPDPSQEPIGPGSRVLKIKDGGGTAGEAVVVLRLAWKTRKLLIERGFRVVMTRTGSEFTHGGGGNADRAAFCNRAGADLMLRIHADGSSDPSSHGASTLYPALRQGWTDDIHASSKRAAGLVQRALVEATGAADRGLVARRDMTGFNWADVPVVLAETGFLTNPRERRLLTSPTYQGRVARGLAEGAAAFVQSQR